MPTQTFIRRLDDGTGKQIDAVTLPSTQVREVFAIADADLDASVAKVKNVAAVAGDFGLVVHAFRGSKTIKHFVSAANNNATILKASPGKVYKVHVFSVRTSPLYVKLYNKTTLPAPTGDGALIIATIACQAGTWRDYVFDDGGADFAAGIGYAVVTGIADNDNNPVAASDCSVEIEWS
jgi:hypothetical protein